MSTRATYSIHGGECMSANLVHFYIHYDGYPEGAAWYFEAMRKFQNSGLKDQFSNKNRGGFAGAFIRANELAEFTSDPESHGDREFHYELYEDGQLKAYRCFWDDKRVPEVFFFGHFSEFLNQYGKDESFSKVYKVGYLTLSQAEVLDLVAHKQQEIADYVAKFPQYTGNASSMRDGLVKFLGQAAVALQGA